MRGKKALPSQEELRKQLIAEDEQFAFKLSKLQADSFPKRLKNMGEWSEAQKAKTAIMQVHGIIAKDAETSLVVPIILPPQMSADEWVKAFAKVTDGA